MRAHPGCESDANRHCEGTSDLGVLVTSPLGDVGDIDRFERTRQDSNLQPSVPKTTFETLNACENGPYDFHILQDSHFLQGDWYANGTARE